MAFPTTPVSEEKLDQGTDSPKEARLTLLDAVQKLNAIIQSFGQALGICSLDAAQKVPTSQLPQGSDSAIGALELATAAEVTAGTDDLRAVTPAGLAARTATTDRAGIIEIATDVEATAGVAQNLAVNPKQLKAAADIVKTMASTDVEYTKTDPGSAWYVAATQLFTPAKSVYNLKITLFYNGHTFQDGDPDEYRDLKVRLLRDGVVVKTFKNAKNAYGQFDVHTELANTTNQLNYTVEVSAVGTASGFQDFIWISGELLVEEL